MKVSLRYWIITGLGLVVFTGCASRRVGPSALGPELSAKSTEAAYSAQAVAASGDDLLADSTAAHTAGPENAGSSPPTVVALATATLYEEPEQTALADGPAPPEPIDAGTTSTPINLPTALAMIGGQHPVVGFAQWRVQEAYAQVDRANVMWLPSIQTGFNYRRRDGNYQAVDGAIVDVNLNSMNYGLGAGAVAAGSPTRPGIVAEFHLADAIFLPKAAEKTAWARGHAAAATLNQQMLDAAVAYIDLLEAYQDYEIISEAVDRTSDLSTLTENFAEAGEGLRSDADRTATELSLLKTRQLAARERQLIASTRLARTLSIPMTSALLPQDPIAVPLEMVSPSSDEPTLIAAGLANRPELKESQALVAAACEAYKREKYAPFVPSVLLGFSTTSFGGGLGGNAENFGGRYDIDAMMVWEMRNLGFGEAAARRERTAQVQQATFAKLAIMDQVAQQVAEAYVQVGLRKQQVETAQVAIGRARDSYQRNFDRIRDGQGLPIEVLQAIQALEASQRAYLQAVADYNRSQFQLQWALGWQVDGAAATTAG